MYAVGIKCLISGKQRPAASRGRYVGQIVRGPRARRASLRIEQQCVCAWKSILRRVLEASQYDHFLYNGHNYA